MSFEKVLAACTTMLGNHPSNFHLAKGFVNLGTKETKIANILINLKRNPELTRRVRRKGGPSARELAEFAPEDFLTPEQRNDRIVRTQQRDADTARARQLREQDGEDCVKCESKASMVTYTERKPSGLGHKCEINYYAVCSSCGK